MDSALSGSIDVSALVATPSDSDLLFDATSPSFLWSECGSSQDWSALYAFDAMSIPLGLSEQLTQPDFRGHGYRISGVSDSSGYSRNSSFSLDVDNSSDDTLISSLAPSGDKEEAQDVLATTDQVSAPSTLSLSSLEAYGIPIETSDPSRQAWRCAYPTCGSRATFTRGSDLRKHYHRHSKHLFCRYDGCPRSERVAAAIAEHCEMSLVGGFSHQHDLERHEAQHKPSVQCEWTARTGQRCARMFSRADNMKDHVKRVHGGGKRKSRSAS